MTAQVRSMCLLTAAIVLPVISTGCRFVLVAHDDKAVFCLTGEEEGELKIDIRSNDRIRPTDLEVEFVGPEFETGEDLLANHTYNAETGEFCFTPAEGADGIVCFNYAWEFVDPPEDAFIRRREAKVTLLIRAADGAPVATNDEATTEQGESVKIDVLANDSWSEGSANRIGLKIQSVEVAEGDGTAEIVRCGRFHCPDDEEDNGEDEGEGEEGDDTAPIYSHGRQCIKYTPPSEDFVGQVTFVYTIIDECDMTATAEVTVEVTGEEPEPEPEPEPQPEPQPEPTPEPSPAPPPEEEGTAMVTFNNDSDQEATFTVDGGDPVVLEPFSSSPPVEVPAGTNLEVRVECPPVGEEEPATKTTSSCTLVDQVEYSIRFFIDGEAQIECTEVE